jgi:hypothetical protein
MIKLLLAQNLSIKKNIIMMIFDVNEDNNNEIPKDEGEMFV